ncbi:hypothetical protein GCM10027347_53880 [Larkinella harenae]
MKKYLIEKIRKLVGVEKNKFLLEAVLMRLDKQETVLNEIYNANLFRDSISSSEWLEKKSFSPGRWAVDYSFLYILYRVLNHVKPKYIVEFGLGQSTKMISQFAEFYDLELSVFENNQEWIDFFQKDFDIGRNCRLNKVELESVHYDGFESIRYKDVVHYLSASEIELIVLDGPIGSKRYSRTQVLDLIPKYINQKHFCVLIDDYNRQGEKDTVNELLNQLEVGNIDYAKVVYTGEKNVMLICSTNNIYLTSL